MAAQNKVKAVGQTIQRRRHVQLGDQRATASSLLMVLTIGHCLISGSPSKYIWVIRRCAQASPESENEYAPDASRWPGCARVGAGLDGAKTVIAVFIGQHPTAAAKVRVNRRQILIFFMSVAAAGIGLPDFHQRVFHRSAKPSRT
jgi:hypothetical protein